MIKNDKIKHRHIDEIVDKSKRLIFAVHRCTKLKWGLSSEVLHTLWREAFEPILLYGCPIWYPAWWAVGTPKSRHQK